MMIILITSAAIIVYYYLKMMSDVNEIKAELVFTQLSVKKHERTIKQLSHDIDKLKKQLNSRGDM